MAQKIFNTQLAHIFSHYSPLPHQAKDKNESTVPTEVKTLLVPDETEEDGSDSDEGEPPISRPPGGEGEPPISDPPGEEEEAEASLGSGDEK